MKLMVAILLYSSFIVNANLYANTAPRDLINNYDLRVYRPTQEGLIDLVFDVEVEGLEEKLSKMKSFGDLREIKFRFYWNVQGKFKIKTIGTPKEFKNLNHTLSSSVLPIFEFFMPLELAKSLRGYELSGNGLNKVRAEDKSLSKGISVLDLDFDNSGRLVQLKSKMAAGLQISNFEYNTMRKSKNRWLLEKVIKRTIYGERSIVANTLVSYKDFSGFLLPKKVVIETFVDDGNKKSESRVLKDNLVFNVSNIRINTDEARKYLKEDK